MARKKQPLEHDNLDIKNNLLGMARTWWASNDFEKQLGSLIIYASFAEYLAEHLLQSVKFAVEQASYSTFGAIIYLESGEKNTTKPLNMYDYINRLENFEFPDKVSIIQLLKETAKARNRLFHDFARISSDDADKLDKYVQAIQAGTEELIDRVNTVESTIKFLTNQVPDVTLPENKDEA